MGQRPMTHQEVRDAVVAHYARGHAVAAVAKLVGIGVKQAREHLRHAGVELRPARVPVDVDAAVARHAAGESVAAIAEDMGVHPLVVRRRLRERGIDTNARPVKRRPHVRVDIDMDDVVRRRREGQTIAAIAAATGHSGTTLQRRLTAMGVTVEVRPTVDTVAVAAHYAAGHSLEDTAVAHDITIHHVIDVLAEHQVPVRESQRRGAPRRGAADPGTYGDIATYYTGGHSLRLTAARFGLTMDAVRDALAARGVPMRTPKQAAIADARREAIATAYRDGASVHEVAAAFGVAVSTVSRALKQSGVKARTRTGKARS